MYIRKYKKQAILSPAHLLSSNWAEQPNYPPCQPTTPRLPRRHFPHRSNSGPVGLSPPSSTTGWALEAFRLMMLGHVLPV